MNAEVVNFDPEAHWQQVYTSKDPQKVSWYAPHLEHSLATIKELTQGKTACSFIDVGAGSSSLVDDVLQLPVFVNSASEPNASEISALDISAAALSLSQKRLGVNAKRVNWLVGNICNIALPEHHYDLWHDRAVFHFLTDANDRELYQTQAARSIKQGGHLVLATFAIGGPEQCSNLKVQQHDEDSINALFAKNFNLLRCENITHTIPGGSAQAFTHFVLQRA